MTRYYHPDEFAELKRIALGLGFVHVEAGPLVRSSYHAHEQADAASHALARRPSDLVAIESAEFPADAPARSVSTRLRVADAPPARPAASGRRRRRRRRATPAVVAAVNRGVAQMGQYDFTAAVATLRGRSPPPIRPTPASASTSRWRASTDRPRATPPRPNGRSAGSSLMRPSAHARSTRSACSVSTPDARPRRRHCSTPWRPPCLATPIQPTSPARHDWPPPPTRRWRGSTRHKRSTRCCAAPITAPSRRCSGSAAPAEAQARARAIPGARARSAGADGRVQVHADGPTGDGRHA